MIGRYNFFKLKLKLVNDYYNCSRSEESLDDLNLISTNFYNSNSLNGAVPLNEQEKGHKKQKL